MVTYNLPNYHVMPATTPNNPSKRKGIDKMNKTQLTEEVHRHNKLTLKDSIK